jgi:hypothetical protein
VSNRFAAPAAAFAFSSLVAFVVGALLVPGDADEATFAVPTSAAAGAGLTLPSPAPLPQVADAQRGSIPVGSLSEALARAAATPRALPQSWSGRACAPPQQEHTPTYLLALFCTESDPLVLSLLAEELGAKAEELSPEQVQLVDRLAREDPLVARRASAISLLGRLSLTPDLLETILQACAPHQQVEMRLAGFAALNDVAAEQPRFADQVDRHLSLLLAQEHDPTCRRAAEAARNFEVTNQLVTAALASRGKATRRH